MSPRRYFTLIVSAALALVAGAYGLSWWLQPVYGDLTRIGGYAERDYGWNVPMREFSPLAATWGGTGYEQQVDLLVLGDSFANLRPHMQWQNWLAMQTGWRIHTLDKHHVDIDALVASPTFRAHPPRVVIWNMIERDLQTEGQGSDSRCATHVSPPRPDALPLRPTSTIHSAFTRPLGLDGINPGFARTWLWKHLLRNGAGISSGDSLLVQLNRSDLFTSRLAGGLLIYRPDLYKRNWRDTDLDRTRCRFAAIAARFEGNGMTRFFTALAPDKSSAYRPWLVNPELVPESRLPALMHDFPVPDARLDLALAKAITRGERDVYMPDDTHWGSTGHAIAADAILKFLDAQGMAR